MTDLTLTLAGPISVTDAQGRDRTPTSMKARGLLALLGTARDLRMSRVKLQDKLWSDRAPEQGSASLRQALAEIRRHLDPLRDALVRGPGWVGLDRDRIAVVLQPPAGCPPGRVEFAEDLRIADEEFEDWLLIQRRHFEDLWSRAPAPSFAPSAPPIYAVEPACLVLSPARTGRDDLDRLVDLAVREGATQAADLLPMLIVDDPRAAAGFANAVNVMVTGDARNAELVLQMGVVRTSTGHQLWSRTFRCPAAEVAGSLSQLSGEVALTLVNALSLPDQTAGAAPGISVLDVFSFSNDRLLRADQALAALPQTHVALTLRAYIRNTQFLERLPRDGRDVLGEASDFAARALEMAPLSSTTLAVAAMVASQRQEVEFSGDLAERAVRADPTNPLARSSLSLALALAGRNEEAHAEALRARAAPLAALSPTSWAIFCAVTAIRSRRFEDARRYSLIAHGYAPQFRPALRFLAALHYEKGDTEGAGDALRKLRAIEPDFSLELMADRSYPVASLRATGLIDVTRSRLI